MRLNLCTLLFVISLCGSPSLLMGQENIDSLITRADQANAHFEYQNSSELYYQAFQLDTLNTSLLSSAAKAAFMAGDTRAAKAYYLELEEKNDTHPTMLNHLASLFEQEDNRPKALKYYTKLTKLYPTNGLYFRKCGNIYLKEGEKGDAFKHLAKAHKLNPKDALSTKALANMLIQNQQMKEADTLLWKGLKYDPENIGLLLLKATNNYKQKMYDSTTVVLEMVNGPIDLSNYHSKMLGYAYMQIDSFDKAIWFLQKSLVNENNPEAAHYYLATAYEKKDEPENAKFHFEQAINAGISGNLGNYHRNLARIYNDENDLKNAIFHYKEAYEYSEDAVLLFYLARASDIYYKDKKIAIRYYDKYIKSEHKNQEYKAYSFDRKRYLKEQNHLNK